MIKAVVFDYGGVLKSPHGLFIDIAGLYKLPEEYVSSKRQEIKEVIKQFDKGLLGEEEFWEKLSEIIGHPMPEDILKSVREVIRENYRKDFEFYSAMLDFNKELRKRGIKTAILSNIIIFQQK